MMKIFLFLSFLGCEGVSISKTTPIIAYPSASADDASDWGNQIHGTKRAKYLPKYITDGDSGSANAGSGSGSNYPTGNDKKFVWSEGVSDSIDTGDFKLDNFAKRSSQDATFDSRHQDRAKFQEQIGRNNADGSDNAGKKSWHHHQHFNDNKYGKIVKGNARGATNKLHNEDVVNEIHSSLDFSQTGKEDDTKDLLELKVEGGAARHLNTSSVISKLGRKVITITAGNNSAGVVGEGTLLKNAADIASGYVALNPGDGDWLKEKKTKDYENEHGVDTVEPIALTDTVNTDDRAVTSLATHLIDTDGNEPISKMEYIKHKYDAPACKAGDWEGTNGCIYRLGNNNGAIDGECGNGVSVGDAVPLCTAQNGTPGSGGSATSCGICRAAGSGADGEAYATHWLEDA